MSEELGKEIASKIDKMVNTFDLEALELAGQQLSTTHPTLQQNFMRLCLAFLKGMANQKYADPRNEASVEVAKAAWEAIKSTKYYYKRDDKVLLPMI